MGPIAAEAQVCELWSETLMMRVLFGLRLSPFRDAGAFMNTYLIREQHYATVGSLLFGVVRK